MGACITCTMRQDHTCLAYIKNKEELKRPISPAPIGGCVRPIVTNYLTQIKPNMRVLEIGCGAWSPIKIHCDEIGAHYEAIDYSKEYFGEPVVATRIENLADLSFENDSFDMVIGNQSLEHWAENGCTNAWGLYQCFRVCKMGGVVALNVPIHFHGTKIFLHGKFDAIQKLFVPHSDKVRLESWGYPSAPIPAVYYHPNIDSLKNSPGYHLDIQATKTKKTNPPVLRNLMGLRGRISQIFNYSLAFNVNRVKKKIFKK